MMTLYKNLFVVFSFTTMIICCWGCKSNQLQKSSGFENDYFTISTLTCTEEIHETAIDSKVGTIICSDIKLAYDYGKYSHQGPITPKEEFRRSFDTYHHIKFFEYRLIDPKVNRLFLDSVKVIDVRRKLDSDETFFECEPCNTTAEITFKGDTYLYPVTLSEKQLSQQGYSCEFTVENGISYKVYQRENEKPALYVTPEENRFKKKNCLAIHVLESDLSDKEIKDILANIRMK